MKKIAILLVLCLVCLLGGCGNSASGSETEADVVIKEKLFTGQINDIWANLDDYLGKTIKYEGVYTVYEDRESDAEYHYVIRYGPGCCGNDGNVGFPIDWDKEYPEPNDWVEIVGVLQRTPENSPSPDYVQIKLSSLKVLPERGQEFVTQ